MVTDVNEAPEFTEGETASRSVAEGTAPNANINDAVDSGASGPVVAMDEDLPVQSLTYTLSGTDATSFAIVSTADGGQLKTLAPLDYETKTDYEVNGHCYRYRRSLRYN